MKTDWIYSATAFLWEPATQVVGRPRLTSSAWLGPESTATSAMGSSSFKIMDMVSSVFSSIPFATSTIRWLSLQNGFIFFAVSRTKTDGTAIDNVYVVGNDSLGVLNESNKAYVTYGGCAQGWALTSGRLAGANAAAKYAA